MSNALGLIGGARADKALVRTGADKALVEALFEVEVDDTLRGWAEQAR